MDVPLTNLAILDLEEDVDPAIAERKLRNALQLAGECSAALAIESNLTVALFRQGKKKEALSRAWRLLRRAEALKDPMYLEQTGHNLSLGLIENGEARAAQSVLEGYRPYGRKHDEQLFAEARRAALLVMASGQAGEGPPASSREQTAFLETLPQESPYRQPWILSPIELL